MNVFVLLRRTLWAIILITCITIVTLYFAVMQVFLSAQSLQTLATKAHLAQTIRGDVLLPKVLSATKSSQYAQLLDEATVKSAFNTAVPLSALEDKLDPAIIAVHEWLNSKQPDIAFSIDVSDLFSKFTDTLAASVSQKVDILPACTYRNSLQDVESLVCRSLLVAKTELKDEVSKAVKAQASISETTITPATISVPQSIINRGKNAPEYLNMFYALSIVSAGIGALIALWLILKHRLSGIITIGAACVAGAGVVYGISSSLERVTALFSDDALSQKISTEAASAFAAFIRFEAIWLLIGGLVAISIAALAKFVVYKYTTKNTMHAEHHGTSKRTLN